MSLRSQALNVEDLDAFSDLYFPFYTCMICDFKNTPSRVHHYKCQKILSEFNSCYFLLQWMQYNGIPCGKGCQAISVFLKTMPVCSTLCFWGFSVVSVRWHGVNIPRLVCPCEWASPNSSGQTCCLLELRPLSVCPCSWTVGFLVQTKTRTYPTPWATHNHHLQTFRLRLHFPYQFLRLFSL